jgi:hypothetical protein
MDGTISVYNSLGALVFAGIFPALSGQYILQVDAFAPGVYYVIVNDHSCKFIKR